LASNSPGIGKSISEIGFPREASIVAIIREEHVVVPNPDSILLGGDEVVVLVTEDAEGQIRLLLCGDAS